MILIPGTYHTMNDVTQRHCNDMIDDAECRVHSFVLLIHRTDHSTIPLLGGSCTHSTKFIHSLLNEWTGFRADQFRQNLRSHRRSWSEFFIFIILSARGGVVWVDRSVWCESERTQIHYYNVDLIYIATLWFQGESPTYILNPFRAPEPLPILYPSNLVPKNGFPVVKGLMRTHNP